jgi:hypothetical protein
MFIFMYYLEFSFKMYYKRLQNTEIIFCNHIKKYLTLQTKSIKTTYDSIEMQ